MITAIALHVVLSVFAAKPAGYVASFEGGVTLTPVKGTKHVLNAKDLERALRLYPGDSLTLAKDANISLVVYGRRVRKSGVGSYAVPKEDPRVGELASRAAMAGRGASGLKDPAPYEVLALLTHQTLGEDPVGNLVPLPDGRLPLVWVANQGGQHVKITLTIEGSDPIDTPWIETHAGGVEGFPFGSVVSEELGKYLLEHVSPDLALPATLEIKGEDGKKNVTHWEIPKQAYMVKATESLRQFELAGFDGFDEAVAFCEGTVGENNALPTYPMMRANLVYQRWKDGPKQWVRLSMLHLLTLEYRFDGLEDRLKKMLEDKDSDGGGK